MARTGLYKSDVKKARDALIAQGKHPSVDAVRVALGNTGSKTTIHKYLKELEEEDGGTDGRKTSISEALQDLVARLAAQLQEEAATRIDEIQTQSMEKERKHAEDLTALRKEVEALRGQLQRVEIEAHKEVAAHGKTREALHTETIARHTMEQQVTDLKERLAENETHRQSLEDKHKHAREALEHYRQSVKEQRDQDQRRHEQQIQQLQTEIRQLQQSLVVKQDEVTRLNQEGARLVADLSHAQKALRDKETLAHQLEQRLAAMPTLEERIRTLEAQRVASAKSVSESEMNLANAQANIAALGEQIHGLQIELATSQAKLGAQQTITAELRAYLDQARTNRLAEQEKAR